MHTLARRNPSQTDTAESSVPSSAAFRRWFGASEVVDEQGQPLVVYHGTTAGGFDAFRPNYRKGEQLGFGIHFAQNRGFAAKYAEDPTVARKGKTPKVYAVYLSIQRPLVADAIVLEGTPEFALAKKLAGSKLMTQRGEDGVRMAYMQNAIDQTTAQRAEKLIREAGYDGILYEAHLSTAAWTGTGVGRARTGSSRSFIVFDPSQVKSATDNAGTFDPAEPSIYRNPRRRGLDVRPGIPGTYRTEFTAKGGKKRTYPAHGAAPWDRTLVRVADETTVASGRVYDTVKRAERAGRAALRGKRGTVEVLRVTNPRRNPREACPTKLMKYEYLGTTDEVTTCDCCGKTNLKNTVAIRDLDEGEVLHFGVTCAARALKVQVADVKKGAADADRQRREEEFRRRDAENRANTALWQEWLIERTGGIYDYDRSPDVFRMVQALGGFAAARVGFEEWKAAKKARSNPRRGGRR